MTLEEKTYQKGYMAETKGNVINSWAGVYDKLVAVLLTPGKVKKLREKILDLTQIEPGEYLLDVGCGTGSLAIAAKKSVGVQGQVIGIDPSSNMLEIADQKAHKARVEVNFRIGVIEDLDFEDDTFDVVLSSLMVHHLPDDLKIAGMQEVYRVLKPGGRFTIIEVEPKTLSLVSLLHGYGQTDGRSSVQSKYHEMMDAAGFKGLDTGKTGVRSLVYIRGEKA